ncbi:poly-beta-1,6-N-acetyl-D-glucosamine N-deacetylase PgaB, partial [bacterium]|nr:poly-beta-1,6-N-acetyl-D-glucosamine N-deacetylase PgaB [bacterium]
MIIRIMIMLLCMVIPANAATSSATAMKPGEFLVLCYHAVPLKPAPGDNYSISQKMFVEQMEYLRTHGYNPVSFKQILDAREGVKALPEKPVLLTFDDGYISYHDFVVPVLEELGYPSVLAVVGNFVGYPPKELPEPIMRWEQIRAVSKKKLVEVVSHSHDLHRAIQYTSQGNIAAAVNILAYDPVSNVYETEADYRSRLNLDFERQDEIFKKELGFSPDVMVWPYGAFNEVSLDIAKQHGIFSTFTLQAGYAHINRLDRLNRVLVENTKIQEFIRNVRNPQGEQYPVRAVQIDLDLIVNPDDPAETDVNLGKLIDRLVAMKVNTVILQAFADPDGDGDVDAVYFPNRVLPVRADIFGWAAHQIKIRDMAVYAWMPTMSIVLPDKAQNERLRVREFKGGESEPSSSWYGRLSPFSPRVADIMGTLYEDLASHAQVAGILFQDDAYLNDFEDFHPDAVARYDKQFGGAVKSLAGEESDIAKEWSRYKTQVIIDFTDVLKGRVQK